MKIMTDKGAKDADVAGKEAQTTAKFHTLVERVKSLPK